MHLYNKILQFELISFSKFWVDHDSQLEDDEQLARALQESLNLENVESPPPRYGHGNGYQPMPMYYPLGSRYFSFELNQCIISISGPSLARAFIECFFTTINFSCWVQLSCPIYFKGFNFFKFITLSLSLILFINFGFSCRICAGCYTEIGYGRYLNCLNAVWHPECFRCRSCNLPISDNEVQNFIPTQLPYHSSLLLI